MKGKSEQRANDGKKEKVELRPDLEDGKRGKDLSYLNEFPQFNVDEGVEGGLPPPPENSEDRESARP